MTKPLCIDLFAGLGGWTEGFLAEGWRVVGFDIEQHVYGEHRYPAQLVLQDVRTIDGKQFKDADMIVASSPCQKYSYMAMPWTKAKDLAKWYRDPAHPERLLELNELFSQPRRIQREACEAANPVSGGKCNAFATCERDAVTRGHFGTRVCSPCFKFGWDAFGPPKEVGYRFIPMIQENVRGAQPWVGRSTWHFGSYHLWGDVPALMPTTRARAKVPGMGAGWRPPGHPDHRPGLDFNSRAERETKNAGGSWFSEGARIGTVKRNDPRDGVKQAKSGRAWFADPDSISGSTSSKSSARKAASARIAKIPFPLASHIARVYYPHRAVEISA